jgi:DNA-binding GntR family transcriptional regulator
MAETDDLRDALSQKLNRSAMSEQVAERLRAKIFARELAPGSWIDLNALAEEFGISRTPLREAIKVLATEGLVKAEVHRGAYVTEVSERDVGEVFHLLALLEGDAAAVAATQASQAQRAQLEALHEALEAAAARSQAPASARAPLGNAHGVGDLEEFFRVNEAFHMALLEIAGNRWLSQSVADLRKVMKLSRHHSLFKEGRIAESLDEHRGIMAALRAHDREAAQTRMRAHIAQGQQAVKVD